MNSFLRGVWAPVFKIVQPAYRFFVSMTLPTAKQVYPRPKPRWFHGGVLVPVSSLYQFLSVDRLQRNQILPPKPARVSRPQTWHLTLGELLTDKSAGCFSLCTFLAGQGKIVTKGLF